MSIRKYFIAAAPYLLIISLCFITRLPQLLSENLILDEDECVVALMAKHLMEGKHVSVFFYGQSYGFSLVESAMISLYSFFIGLNDYSIKLSMLTLFAVGIIFFYETLKEIMPTNKWVPWLITMVFIFSPIWAAWSMKARGGYLTTFPLSAILLWYLLRNKEKSITGNFLIGVVLALIAYSQPLWLPGLFPFIVYCWYQEDGRLCPFVAFAVGNLVTIGMFTILQRYAGTYWSPKVFDIRMPGLTDLPLLLYDHLNGFYYLDNVYPAPLISKVYSCMFLVVILIVLGLALRYVSTDLKNRLLFLSAATAVAFTLGYCFFLNSHSPRYLLPLSGFALLGVAVLLTNIKKQWLIVITVPFIVIGAMALVAFKDFKFSGTTEAELMTSIDWLDKHHIHNVFTPDVPTQWQMVFYSKEKIICRGNDLKDRVPEYIEQVTGMYKNHPEKTALVDPTNYLPDMEPDSLTMAGQKYYAVINPDTLLLKEMEFVYKK